VCVKGEYKVYTNPTPSNYSKYKNKEKYTHIIILKTHIIYTYPKRKKNEKEKNKKKKHINFAHPNKWSNSLAQ